MQVTRFARARRVLVCALMLLGGGCQFLQNEFITLNRVPPSVQAAQQAPAPQPW
jgi:hypothetical protein